MRRKGSHKRGASGYCSERRKDVHSGGSGCGCAATVLSSFILPEMEKKNLKDILFVATGALLSADSVKQGLTIPAVAHLVHLTGNNA